MTPEREAWALCGFLAEIGSSKTVERPLYGYGNVLTRAAYIRELAIYFMVK